jgi:hypothetical protein
MRALAGAFIFSAALLTGCASARVAQGPSISSLAMRDNQPVIEVAMVKDGRAKTHAGTIGAAGISVPATVKTTLHNYLVSTLYDNFAVSVKPVGENQTKPEAGSEKLVSSKLESISIFSFDSIMQAVDTRTVLQLIIYDAAGAKVYEKAYQGFYQERIGMAWDTDGVVGNLVEDAIRDMMKQVAADGELKKILENR